MDQIIKLVTANPGFTAIAVTVLLFILKDRSGSPYLFAIFNWVKSVATPTVASAAHAPDSDVLGEQCCTTSGRLTVIAHLVQHCESIGEDQAAQMLQSSIPALMRTKK